MLSPRKKSPENAFQEQMASAAPAERMMIAYRYEMNNRAVKKRQGAGVSWKGNL